MPNYQTFRGYPDVVGNFNAGQDRGRQMAADDFNTRQTVETQNALLQRSNEAGAGAKSYADLQAMQMQAKQMSDTYLPAFQSAVENENYAMRDAIVEAMRKTGNPLLGKFADVAATAKKLDARQYVITGDIPDEEAATKFLEANPQVKAGLGGASLPPGKYDFTFTGMPGTPGAVLTKAVTSIHGQPKTKPVAVLDEKALEAYREQVPEEVFQQMTDHVKAANGRPVYFAVGVDGVPTGNVAKFGPAPAGKTSHDTISTPGDLDYWRDKASPAAFEKLMKFAKENVGKPFSIELSKDGKPTGNVLNLQRPPTAGAGAPGGTSGAFPVLKYNAPGKYYGTLFTKPSGETEFATLVSRFLSASVGGRNAFQAVGLSAGKQNDAKREEFLARVSDYMASFGITQADITDAAGALSATKQLSKQQAMLEVNASVAEKGFSMLADLRKKGQISTNAIPLLNHAENVLRTWTGDAPPGAAQGVLTETLVDYAKVVSGQTSTSGVTMYAAKLAKELMELKDSPKQFQLKLDQYQKLMRARLVGGRTMLKGLGKTTDIGNKGEENIAPVGTKAKLKNGSIVVSDGKGGWK